MELVKLVGARAGSEEGSEVCGRGNDSPVVEVCGARLLCEGSRVNG